jgi:hypothetical protein
MTGIWAGRSRVLIPEGESGFSILLESRLGFWPTQHPSSWVLWTVSYGVVAFVRLAIHLRSPCPHGVYRHKFTFYILYSVVWIGGRL